MRGNENQKSFKESVIKQSALVYNNNNNLLLTYPHKEPYILEDKAGGGDLEPFQNNNQ